MSKKKWYKSKGGWIGAIILTLLTYAFSKGMFFYGDIDNPPILIKIISLPLLILDFLNINTSFEINLVVMALYGFLIGYFIQKKFFKKRR